MKTIIVDDEPLALEILEEFVKKVPELKLIKKCQNAIEAGEALRKHEVDLIFLDIQMPQITGIEFAKSLTHPPKIIFTTAFSQYALDGFELNAWLNLAMDCWNLRNPKVDLTLFLSKLIKNSYA